MNKQKVFCPECRREVPYRTEEILDKAELRGKEYSFTAHRAYCVECGEEVYVAALEDLRLKALYDSYRIENDIISLEEIQALPDRYNIGKRPLSLLLGWGEQTFSRYYEGDMPTKQYSDILKNIAESPAFYLSLLDKGKNKGITDVAYRKSKAATEELLKQDQTHIRSKIDDVVDYLLFHCRDVTPLTLQKGLYYAQGFYYAFFGSYLFEDTCQAWVHGPAYPKIYGRFKNYCFDPIDRVEEEGPWYLAGEEILLLENIVKHVFCFSGKTLEAFTHTEAPWITARHGLDPDALSKRTISNESIGRYFVSVRDKYKMLTPANIKDYTWDLFGQI